MWGEVSPLPPARRYAPLRLGAYGTPLSGGVPPQRPPATRPAMTMPRHCTRHPPPFPSLRTRRVKQSSGEAASAGLLRRFAPRNDEGPLTMTGAMTREPSSLRTRKVKQSSGEAASAGLLRRFAPRNDGGPLTMTGAMTREPSSLRTRRVKQSSRGALCTRRGPDNRSRCDTHKGLHGRWRGALRGPLQPSASCFGLPGRGVLSNASIRGRLGYAHKTMHRMVLSHR
ncbi:MAG: hypothetical protein LBT00_11435 [Spirochaetaceae bacterium]|nr:hypothetical protein [Spirochaetaceae bacterium]